MPSIALNLPCLRNILIFSLYSLKGSLSRTVVGLMNDHPEKISELKSTISDLKTQNTGLTNDKSQLEKEKAALVDGRQKLKKQHDQLVLQIAELEKKEKE
jgi:hypothetical protein